MYGGRLGLNTAKAASPPCVQRGTWSPGPGRMLGLDQGLGVGLASAMQRFGLSSSARARALQLRWHVRTPYDRYQGGRNAQMIKTQWRRVRLWMLGTAPFWRWRDRGRRARLWFHSREVGLRRRGGRVRQGGRTLVELTARALASGAVAIGLFAAVELLARSIAGLDYGVTEWMAQPLTQADFEAVVITAVGAEGVFLGLYFTTVGVIAATAYAEVPGEIRSMFVAEPRSRMYTNAVVAAIVFGLGLLGAGSLGFTPYRMTLAAFAFLTVLSVLSLVSLGSDLFNFFDLSALSRSLPSEFLQAVRGASTNRWRTSDAQRQQALHADGARVLRTYRQLVELVVLRKGGEARAPIRLLIQQLMLWNNYSARKASIPTGSQWFALAVDHPSWLTLDSTRLNLALSTRTSVQAGTKPDRLWVETELAEQFKELMPLVVESRDWPQAISLLDRSNDLVGALVVRWQVDEALILARATASLLVDAHETADDESGTLRLAAVERSTLSLTAAWLGFGRSMRGIDPDKMSASVDRAVSTELGPYSAGLPVSILPLLEEVTAGLEFERRTEGRTVTPDWWIHHMCGRELSKAVCDTARSLTAEVERAVVRAGEDDGALAPDERAVLAFAGMELCAKMHANLYEAQSALVRLETLHRPAAGDGAWEELDASTSDEIRDFERRLVMTLARAARELPEKDHTGDRPDLFGQAYRTIHDVAFAAILSGDDDLALKLFGELMAFVDRARLRLFADLEGAAPDSQIAFVIEPFLDVMELSGAALLMHELDDSGVWTGVKSMWDSVLDAASQPPLASHLLVALEARDSIFALTPGGLQRTNRRRQVAEVMASRGVQRRNAFFSFTPEPGPPADQSPVVTAMSPTQMGMDRDLPDLFAAEYLLGRGDVSDGPVPSKAAELRRRIEREREKRAADPAAATGSSEPAEPQGDPTAEEPTEPEEPTPNEGSSKA